MDDPGLFALFGAALGLGTPWQVMSVAFDEEAGKLVIGLDFPRGSRFACPVQGCGESACGVHDAVEKSWRHLDFFEHQVFLSARVPRVSCPEHGVHLVAVPWARPGSGFTLLMEVAMITFAKQMPIAPLARMTREHDTRLWRVSSTMSVLLGPLWTSRVSARSAWTRPRRGGARTTSRSSWTCRSGG